MATCYIALGSNLGERHRLLDDAMRRLNAAPGVEVARVSRYVETNPVGGPAGQRAYLNAAAELHTTLSPHQLLGVLQSIERALGRVRSERWGPRTIDLDLLLFDDAVIESPDLTVPHPRLPLRRFVLAPLAEIGARVRHPASRQTVGQMLARLERRPRYLAITGPIAAGKTTLARAVSARIGATGVFEQPDPVELARFYADPSRRSLPIQIEFVGRRTAALDPRRFPVADGWVVSDFWFDQSLVFGDVLLSGDEQRSYRAWCGESRRLVLEPTAIVWLDAPAELLLARIRGRGHDYERQLDHDYLARLRREFERALAAPGLPPVVQYAANDETLLADVFAIIQGISG